MTEVSITPRGIGGSSATGGGVMVEHRVDVGSELVGCDRGRAGECGERGVCADNWRARNGTSSPTGTPFRVTTKASPRSSARMTSPLPLRSSRCVISRATGSA